MGFDKVSRIAILGATGYVGGRLVGRLAEKDLLVRCIVRNPERVESANWKNKVEIVSGDTTKPETLTSGFKDCEIVYYLVHAMSEKGQDFSEMDRVSALNVAKAAKEAGVKRIIYLGGLGDDTDPLLSKHLSSRHEVGDLLASQGVPVTELRAAVILGSGSASFEMLRSLTEVLPIMVVPKWVHKTKCQPISITDVLFYLEEILYVPDTVGKVLDIGGPEVLTYRDMMQRYAQVAGLKKRIIVPVPVLSPSLSSHWINVVTPLPIDLGKHLVKSLCNDVVVRPNSDIQQYIPHETIDFDESIRVALTRIKNLDVQTSWSDAVTVEAALPDVTDPNWSGGKVFTDTRKTFFDGDPRSLYNTVCSLGGNNGWYSSTFLWHIRGALDKIIGGVGFRRGRKHPTKLSVGDVVDFFRVDEIEEPRLLRLKAEMKVPGNAWLQWEIKDYQSAGQEGEQKKIMITQTAFFAPKGLLGRIYWYAIAPFHAVIFPLMLKEIVKNSRKVAIQDSAP